MLDSRGLVRREASTTSPLDAAMLFVDLRPGYGFFSLWIHAKLRIPRERVSLIDAKNAHNHGMAMKTDRVMVAYIRTFFFE